MSSCQTSSQGANPYPGCPSIWGKPKTTLCLRELVYQRTNGRAESDVWECRRYNRPKEAFRDNEAANRRNIALWDPIHNAPYAGFDWLANLFSAQLGFCRRISGFPQPIQI